MLPEIAHDPLACGTDGHRVYLPRSLDLADGEGRLAAADSTAGREEAIALYRLLAVQQAARLVRGTPATAAQIQSGDTRDWFLLAEAAAIDRWIALQTPGLAGRSARRRGPMPSRAGVESAPGMPRRTQSSARCVPFSPPIRWPRVLDIE